jgi:hypothetical protein
MPPDFLSCLTFRYSFHKKLYLLWDSFAQTKHVNVNKKSVSLTCILAIAGMFYVVTCLTNGSSIVFHS